MLTVDVDVYKGALANTEEVQAEQVISLAMGSKPLLIQLRDHLEVSHGPFPVWTTKGRNPVSSADDLQARLTEWRANTNYNAGGITAKNVFDDEFAVSVNDILGLYDDTSLPELSDTIIEAEDMLNNFKAGSAFLSQTSPALWTNLSVLPADAALFYAYSNLYVGKARGSNFALLVATNGISTTNLSIAAQSRQLVEKLGTNATNIFGTNGGAIEGFTNQMRARIEAYGGACDSLHRLMVLALESIPRIYSSTHLTPGTREALQRAAAKVAATVVDLSVLAQKESTCNSNLASLFANYSCTLENAGLSLGGLTNLSAAQWEKAQSAFANVLAADDGGASVALLDLDANMLRQEGGYGLARKPFSSTSELNDVITSVAVLTSLGGSLSHGRRSIGLESAIEAYLGQPYTCHTPEAWATNAEFADLMDSLTEFGEKVATIGNSAILLQNIDDPDVSAYINILQSVGNSIIVHVDELKAQAAYHRSLQKNAVLTAQAINDAGFTNAVFKSWATNWGTTNVIGYDSKEMIDQLSRVLQMEYLKELQNQARAAAANGNASSNALSSGAKDQKAAILAADTNLVLILQPDTNGLISMAQAVLGSNAPEIPAPPPCAFIRHECDDQL